MKQCPKCKIISNDFNKNRSKPDGLQNYCRTCQTEITKKYNHSDKGIKRVIAYKSTDEWKNKNKSWQKKYSQTTSGVISNRKKVTKYQINNPEVKKAHDAIYYAKKVGKIPYPETLLCDYCGDTAKEYHHHKGYSKENRLSVIPLCVSCHRATLRNNQIQLG